MLESGLQRLYRRAEIGSGPEQNQILNELALGASVAP
jgi:hypothetical protein